MTEKELIILLKEGDEKAFTTLYRRYWSKVYNFSRLYLSSILEIEEVVQEVFVKVWESRSLLREDDNFKGFLFVITRNLVFNQFRRSFNENAYKLTVLSSIMPYYNLEEELTAADLQEFIEKMVILEKYIEIVCAYGAYQCIFVFPGAGNADSHHIH